jgi:hypothetical protein
MRRVGFITSLQILALFGLMLENVFCTFDIILLYRIGISLQILIFTSQNTIWWNSGLDYRDWKRRWTSIFLCFLKSVSEGDHTAVIWSRCTEGSTVISWPVGVSVNGCSAVVTSPEDSLSLGRYLGPERPLSTYIDPRTCSVRVRVYEPSAVTGVHCSLSTPENSRIVGISVYSVRTSCPQVALRLRRDTCAPSLGVASHVYSSLSSHPGLPLFLKREHLHGTL